MICVSLESLAGLSTLLWLHGMSRSATLATPSLWRAEGHYLWHLVDSVPLLSVPRTLGWRDPKPFTDYTSGALLLAFKVAIIAPLIRLGLSGYQFFEARRVQVAAKREEKQRRKQEEQWRKEAQKRLQRGEKPPDWQPGLRESLWFLPVLLLQLGIAVAAMVWLSDPGFWVNRWLDRIPPEVSIHNFQLSLAWFHAASPWLLVVVLIVVIGNAIPSFSTRRNQTKPAPPPPRRGLSWPIFCYLRFSPSRPQRYHLRFFATALLLFDRRSRQGVGRRPQLMPMRGRLPMHYPARIYQRHSIGLCNIGSWTIGARRFCSYTRSLL